MMRLAAACALTVLLVGADPGGGAPAVGVRVAVTAGPAPATTQPGGYSAPLSPVDVVRGFEPPPTPYASGHRGVDLSAGPGTVVRAAGAGQVSFAGPVAGRGVVVIAHPDGVSTEYEPVTPMVHVGARVVRGQPIGRVHGAHGSCAPDRCLHWGARRDGSYFDPLSLLRALGPVRLLPWADQARGWARA